MGHRAPFAVEETSSPVLYYMAEMHRCQDGGQFSSFNMHDLCAVHLEKYFFLCIKKKKKSKDKKNTAELIRYMLQKIFL